MFKKTSSAIVYSLIKNNNVNRHDVFSYVIRQHKRMPDIYRLPISFLTITLGISTIFYKGHFFYNLNSQEKIGVIEKIKASRISIFINFIKFYESLVIFSTYNQDSFKTS